jgi:hypothetical protein
MHSPSHERLWYVAAVRGFNSIVDVTGEAWERSKPNSISVATQFLISKFSVIYVYE